MRHILFLLFMAFTLQAIAQYPATGNKMRLGWQTTGDGLVYRGAIGDTTTLDPSGLNNAWMLLDTANGNLYAYRAKAWRLVSGGGGSVSDTLTGEVKGPLDSTYIDTVANIIFRLDSTAVGVGEVKYNDTQGSIQQGLKGGNVTNVIGQQLHQRVLNKTGSPLAKGEAVYLQGSQGNRITVAKAIATIDSTSANTFGIVAESIANNQSGYVITEGLITNMNTNALTEGAAVYLSPTVAGGLTTTKPQAPDHGVYIGVCVKQNNGSGELFVKIRNGQELEELHDVRITSPASNASLYYNAAQGIWRDTGAAVLVADTAAMLSPYLKKADTLSLSNRINTKLNISDTSAMLTNYINVVDTAAMLTNYINIADTATMLSSYISNADTSVFARDFQISGTTNYLAKFTGSNAVGNSVAFETGRNLYINSAQGNTSNALNNSFEFNGYGSAALDQPFLAVIGNVGVADYRPRLAMYRTKGTTVNDRTLVPFNHHLGSIQWNAADGVDMLSTGAEITAITDSITGENDMPTALTFATTANGSASTTERMRITSPGNVGINTTTPAYRLDVNGDVNTTGMYKKSGTDIISGTTNRLAMFTGANTVGNGPISKQADTINFVDSDGFVTFRFRNKYGTDSGSGDSGRFPGFPVGTRFAGMINGSQFASFSFGDPSGINGYNAAMQLTAWAGGYSDYYSTRFRTDYNGDFGLFLSPVANNANPTYSATPNLSILRSSGNVGIATSSPSRPLHVNANSSMIIPSGATGTRPASGANGDIRYSTTFNNIEFYDLSRGLWERPLVGTVANNKVAFASGDTLTSNTNFHWDNTNTRLGIGTASPQVALEINGRMRLSRGTNNTFIGFDAGNDTITGNRNIGIGNGTLSLISSGTFNIGIGSQVLAANTTGSNNFGIGVQSLLKNTTGSSNVSFGVAAMFENTTGSGNLAIGTSALNKNTTASNNVGIGYAALYNNTIGENNVALGYQALFSSTTVSQNVAIGTGALQTTTGEKSTAIGAYALQSATTGTQNLAIGNNAAVLVAGGSNNTILGSGAAITTSSGGNNTQMDNAVIIGQDARPSASGNSNEIVIGYQCRGNGSNTTTIGNSSTTKTFFQYGETYIGTATDNGAYNLQVAGGSYLSGEIKYVNRPAAAAVTNVGVDANGVLREATSSQRFKDNITPYQKGLSDAMRLQAKTYTYKGDTTLQAGFIAEDVHEAGLNEYVNYDKEGKPYSLQYGNMVTLLLNAMKEQQAQIEALKKEIEALKNK